MFMCVDVMDVDEYYNCCCCFLDSILTKERAAGREGEYRDTYVGCLYFYPLCCTRRLMTRSLNHTAPKQQKGHVKLQTTTANSNRRV